MKQLIVHNHIDSIPVPYEKNMKVEIKKPSTAEDLRLLDEMRKEARESILFSELIENNLLKDAHFDVVNDFLQNKICLCFSVMLNGEKITHHVRIENSDFENPQEIIEKMKRLIADTFSTYILFSTNILDDFFKKRR